jgi:hypothetical protein
VAHDDLELDAAEEMSLREMVGINLPLNQLACTGVGQAQPLSQLARKLQSEVNAGKLGSVQKYFDRFEAFVNRSESIGWPKRAAARLVIKVARRGLMELLGSVEHARYSSEFLTRPVVRDRFRKYYSYTLRELERLKAERGLSIPEPTHVVFGHTHQPIPWDAEELIDVVDGRAIRFCNTGGWILKENSSLELVGAEVLLCESGKGIRSVSVRTPDVYPYERAARPAVLQESPSRGRGRGRV